MERREEGKKEGNLSYNDEHDEGIKMRMYRA